MATSNAVGRSPLSPCDFMMAERAGADDNAAAWPDVDVEELLRAHDIDQQDQETMAEAVKKAKKEALNKRHRRNMARARSRQDKRMTEMRKEYQYLSEKLGSSVEAWKRLQEQVIGGDFGIQDNDAERVDDGGFASASSGHRTVKVASVPNRELYARYVAAVETENAIHDENEALTRRLEQLAIFETMLRVDTPEEDHARPASQLKEESKKPSGPRGPLNRPGYWSYFARDTKPFYYVPMTGPQCHLLIRNMYQSSQNHHLRFVTQLGRQHPRDRMHFLGWTVQREVIDGTQFHFHFTKVFPCSDSSALAEDMADEGWRIFNSPERYKKIYRTPMDVRVLQRVDAFNTVILRNSPDASGTHRTRHLTLMSKISDTNARGQKSLAILTLVVQPPTDAANSGKSDVRFIRDAYTYLRFDMCMGCVRLTYGGHGDCLHPALAKYLFVETGNVLLRFEQMVFPSNLVTFS